MSELEFEPATGDVRNDTIWVLPVGTLRRHKPRSRLYNDHKEHKVVAYRLLQKVNDNEWLIDVNSRTYVIEEDVLEAGHGAMKD